MPWRYPRVIVHRGGGALAPENTLAGLRIAARLGCVAVEFDAMLSADGVPILIHDETLVRTTGCDGRVDGMSADRLCALDAGRRHHVAYAGERLPSLADALDACAALGLRANVEIKPAAGAEAATGQVVGEVVGDRVGRLPHGAPAVLLSSFSVLALESARRVSPALPRALLVEEIPGDWQERVRAQGCAALHASASDLRPEQVAAVRRAGVPLACYTVNDPVRAQALFALGVAAVFTDRPDLFPAGEGDPAP